MLLAIRASGPIAARQVTVLRLATGSGFDSSPDIALNTAHREGDGSDHADVAFNSVFVDAEGYNNSPLKAVLDLGDVVSLETSTGGVFSKVKATLQVFKNLFDTLYAKLSGTTPHGLITGAATIDSGVNSEHTGNIVADVTLNVVLTPAYPSAKIMLDLLTDTTALTVTILAAGYSVIFPINQAQTLTALPDGYYEIIPTLNVTKGIVVVRVQQVT